MDRTWTRPIVAIPDNVCLSRLIIWLWQIFIPTWNWSKIFFAFPGYTHFISSLQTFHNALIGVWDHRPYSRQVTERMGCDVVIHLPPSIYPKAGNGALRDQWAIKYNCQNESSTIAFTVRDLVHWNYVISQNIPRVCKSWKSLSIYVFAAYIFCSLDTQSTEVNFQ